jgi:branched-chain amino acid transport system permease protein
MNTRKSSTILYFIAIMIVLTISPFVVRDIQFQHVLIMIMLFATLSQAWNILGGYAGQVSFGHACFFGIGAYGSLALLNNWGLTPWAGMLIGGIVSVGLAILIGFPVFKLKGHYFAISTLAIAEVIRELFSSWKWVDGTIGLDAPVLEPSLYHLMFYKTKVPYHFTVLAFFVAMTLITYWIERSRMGYYFRAIKQSPDAAEGIGVNTSRYKLYALIISAFFTAICGSVYAQYVLHIEPSTVMSVDISIKIVLVAVLGGAGTIWGPLLGAMILIPLSEYSRIWLGGTGMGIDLIIFGALILFISIFQPAGIVGILRRFTQKTEE